MLGSPHATDLPLWPGAIFDVKLREQLLFLSLHCTAMTVSFQMQKRVDKEECGKKTERFIPRPAFPFCLPEIEHDLPALFLERKREDIRNIGLFAIGPVEFLGIGIPGNDQGEDVLLSEHSPFHAQKRKDGHPPLCESCDRES